MYHSRVRRQDFSYALPEELIAQSPLAERAASRLLVLEGASGALADRAMADLPSYLRAGDLLVFNDTRVVAARVVGSKPSGGRVEIFLERVVGGQGETRQALVQLRASKPIREGLEITTAGGVVRVVGREEELWRVEAPSEPLEFFEAWGEVPLPPYIHRAADASDRERYQSIFAREKGAVAAPTASLHFDAPLVAKFEAMGVERAFVTLHVGAGTFQPLRTDDLDAHKMHAERVSVSAATWEAAQRTRASGGRVVAVGTTVVRALEAAALHVVGRESAGAIPSVVASGARTPATAALHAMAAEAALSDAKVPAAARDARCVETAPDAEVTSRDVLASGLALHATAAGAAAISDAKVPTAAPNAQVIPTAFRAERTPPDPAASATPIFSGETRLFIRPGFAFQVVDAMVTNFHLPESTLLMLVSAFAGRENVLNAYTHAVREKYRFFSYGDAMLVTPAARAKTEAPTP